MIGTFWSDLVVALIQCNAAIFLTFLEANNSNTENCHSSFSFYTLVCELSHSKFEIKSELQNFDHFN